MDVVLVQPEIPQNTGNVARTCVAINAKLWLVKPLGFQLSDHHLKRAGLDYWQYLDWETVGNWDELTHRLTEKRHWFFSRQAVREYTSAQFTADDVLVFGSESQGLPDSLRTEFNADQWLRVPTSANVRSLNLANTVAVAAYEALRQIAL
jgi:tRNA (cytidine/uridine-2'-O-)-methyltransferase